MSTERVVKAAKAWVDTQDNPVKDVDVQDNREADAEFELMEAVHNLEAAA